MTMAVTGNRPDGLSALSLPPVTTDRMFVSRGGTLYREDLSRMHGGLLTRKASIIKPATADFNTWVNQNSATLTDNGDAQSLEYGNGVTSGTLVAGRERNLPAGNWDIQIGARKMWNAKSFLLGGIFLRESATSKLEHLGFGHGFVGDGMNMSRFTNPNTFLSDRRGSIEFITPNCWFRLRHWADVYQAMVSPDGVLWQEFTNPISMTNFFTTAPDKWGYCIQPVNNGGTNATGMRLDVFDWLEGTETDQFEFPTYRNNDASGDRTSRITVTFSGTFTDGVASKLVDFGFGSSAAAGACAWTGGLSGQTLTFQFTEQKIITEAFFYQNATVGGAGHGQWKWQGSNNGSSYTDITTSFTLDAGSAGTVQGDMSANVTPYSYYRLFQTSGTTSNTPWMREFEFKIVKG